MSDWYPTPELRFVERVSAISGERVSVLQQRWRCDNFDACAVETEWRDVPLVEEGDE
jgi:hypothetical protein